MKNHMLLFSMVALACALAMTACTKKNSPAVPVSQMTAEQLSARGKSVYISNCIACHNVDPAKDGSIGPAVAGSTAELLDPRILRAEYPAGYKPKRDTRIMAALPHLKEEIPALAAYLSAIGTTAK